MTTKKKPAQPFVIIMRHDSGADPHVAVRATWEDALLRAGKFWESYDGEFHPTAKRADDMFKAGEGYDQRVDITMHRGRYLHLMHAGGSGPCCDVERAED